ncbi:MAG: hypothetical protein KGM24_14400 [Elusimicrobia bacterium]|nr:hypothetical protein [Elusimicrobiota bacterium]
MRRSLLLSGLLLAAACARKPAAPKGEVAYSPADGSFTAALPRGWRVNEAELGTRRAAFYGPPDGKAPYSELIGVYFYPSSGRWSDPADYAQAESAIGVATPVSRTEAAGVSALSFEVRRELPDPHLGVQRTTTREILVPARGGFFALIHSYPTDGPPPGPAFDAFVASFRLPR